MKKKICHCFDIPVVALIAMVVLLWLFMLVGFKVGEINEQHHPLVENTNGQQRA